MITYDAYDFLQEIHFLLPAYIDIRYIWAVKYKYDKYNY